VQREPERADPLERFVSIPDQDGDNRLAPVVAVGKKKVVALPLSARKERRWRVRRRSGDLVRQRKREEGESLPNLSKEKKPGRLVRCIKKRSRPMVSMPRPEKKRQEKAICQEPAQKELLSASF